MFRKSSYSGSEGNNCVEVWRSAESVVVRDSKAPQGGVVRMSPAAFDQLLEVLGRRTHMSRQVGQILPVS
ncbi:DUF397 domain-containing protein [Saccharothrix stipae]